MNKETPIFALDIGTRSVVGIMLQQMNDHYTILDLVIKEHHERAMLDGQIHDVLAVASVMKDIKETLEQKYGPLKRVSVAAAGRALKTERAEATLLIAGKPMMTKEDVKHLELSAVQQAQIKLASQQQEQSHHYYCVGYSVVNYKIDGQEIGSLIDQQGTEATVEVIATFLPKLVVESLLAALQRAGLEMEALTLEPIAAINVLIPPTMRRLNVALVDIGAGTSDIAITDLGTVIAYGMVPIAGDEITEAISDHYLLDFPLAEKAKRELSANETVTITDILGFETEVSRDEMIASISDAIDRLAHAISEEILLLNSGKPPKAVMLVGGGSLTPELPKRLAEKLQLPENRVAIRGIDAIQKLELTPKIAERGPELVTPIGIAIASKQNPVQYITVSVNDQLLRLFDMKALTVGDCLLAAGIPFQKLYGKPGMALVVTVNGQTVTIPGTYGEPPLIVKNGVISSLDEQVHDGDKIVVEKGKDGVPATVQLRDLIDELPCKNVTINGERYKVKATVYRNGQAVSLDNSVNDRDIIVVKMPETIEELLIELHLVEWIQKIKPFTVNINGLSVELKQFSGKIYKNNMETKLHSNFEDGDIIEIENGTDPTVIELATAKNIQLHYSIPITFHGKPLTLSKRIVEVYKEGQLLDETDVIENGSSLELIEKKREPFIFQDVFNYVQIDIPSSASKTFTLLKNGEPVTFYDPIAPGDELQIVWEATSAEMK
ncbi:cell division protein FtsA [Anoxybacillus caldiproteolyticus]|uniref:Cell division protein FtsA n=2 Tax=Thermaerobacillus caldiproteolyticus TaxID=247480 RepID=A0A7V9Z4J5_9BACL|nr:cell division protein FtsA [Anoxybacillus caldiproteolyticus]